MHWSIQNICFEFGPRVLSNTHRHWRGQTTAYLIRKWEWFFCPPTESWVGVVGCCSCGWNTVPHEGLNGRHRCLEVELWTAIRKNEERGLAGRWSNGGKICVTKRKIRVMTEEVRCSILSCANSSSKINFAAERIMILCFLKERNVSLLFNTLLSSFINCQQYRPIAMSAVELTSRHYRVIIVSVIVIHKCNAIFIATVINVVIFLLECSSLCYAQKEKNK